MEYSVHEAKTHFSKILAAVSQGEEVVITSGKARKRIARILRVEEPKRPLIGFARDWPELGPEFFEPLPKDELHLWNG